MSALSELVADFGDAVVHDPDVLASYAFDRGSFGSAGRALAMVRPACTADVQRLAAWATRHRAPLVPRGAGTGLSGGANASDGCVLVNFERMNRILAIDEAALLAVVQPGVLNVELKRAAEASGLWYPPDPSSYEIATLGGNVATNAGGFCCVKYGVTRDYVLGLEAVLADGSVVRTGGAVRKDVAGYDLTRLLVGSEGTLAMITEITLRLRRPPAPPATLLASFDELDAAGAAVTRMVRAADVALLELMDNASLRAVESFASLELDTSAAALLIAQSDRPDAADLSELRAACEAAGASSVIVTSDPAEGRLLINARRLAYPALERLGNVLIDDVVVPLPALPEMLRRIERVARATETLVATVAHAGDGNLHPNVVYARGDAQAEARARAAFTQIMEQALELGGTITGEHGVGSFKVGFLERQLGAPLLALHRGIKQLFDPLGILNPGKVLANDGGG